MNRGIYAAATGMSASSEWLDVIANNLANAGTTGFKRDGVAFNEALLRTMNDAGGAGGRVGDLGSGPGAILRFTHFEQGPMEATGNPLDVAIETPEGAFAVQTPAGVRFTRDGSFTRNPDGQLITHRGHLVLDADRQPIELPPGKVQIEGDGSITVEGQPIAQIGVFEGTFAKTGDALWISTNAQPAETPAVRQGALERSNVNVVESMVDMIKLNRAFELSQRSIQTQDEMTSRLLSSLTGR